MGLRLKFNLMLLLVFAIGLSVTGYISYDLLHRNARGEVLRNAGLMMEAAMSMRGYTNTQIRPLIPYNDEIFHPQSVPAYSATEIMAALHKKYADYSYKEATLNPTNPRNRAVEWETDIVNVFRNDPARTEISGTRETPTGRSLYLARPFQIKDKACLTCHTTAAEAPPAMVKIYGPNNGFGWKHMEVIGAQVVSVPMSVPVQNADRAFYTFMISLSSVFLALFIILNVMMSLLIVRPITRMSAAADKISTGNVDDMDIAEFSETGKDEVATLGKSFNRMRRSLVVAINMIDREPPP
jgi:protein-histidine pros-kinase